MLLLVCGVGALVGIGTNASRLVSVSQRHLQIADNALSRELNARETAAYNHKLRDQCVVWRQAGLSFDWQTESSHHTNHGAKSLDEWYTLEMASRDRYIKEAEQEAEYFHRLRERHLFFAFRPWRARD
jgi:hypothetical protein